MNLWKRNSGCTAKLLKKTADCNFTLCGAKLVSVCSYGGGMAKYSDFLTYCVFGFLATLVNMGTYHLLYDTASLSNVAATVLAWFTAVTFAFFTNKFIVFKNRGMKAIQVVRELAMFYSARFSTGVIDVVFMFITVDLLTFPPLVCKFLSNIIQGIINYLAGKLIIFRKK